MGFPSTSCEAIYRNSLKEVLRYFKEEHDNKVKIYNLCIEPERIYSKATMNGLSVTLFPFADHQTCSIK